LKLKVLSVAELEAADAALWYEHKRQGLGDEFLADLTRAFEQIQVAPRVSSPLEYYTGSHDIRRCLLQRFPYLIVYLCRADEVLVLAIGHARRKPLYWLSRLS
jgi:hypothetical protein